MPTSCLKCHSHPFRTEEVRLFYKLFYFIFGCAGSSLLWAFFSCDQQGLLSSCSWLASHCGGFSYCRAWSLGLQASVVGVHGLCCSTVCGTFPALAGGFLSTVPPGKSSNSLILAHNAQFLSFSMHVNIPKTLSSSAHVVNSQS